MDWTKLLSTKRLEKTEPEEPSTGRSEFQRDFDRITFSSSFRRLQDKTQVVPLAESDYVRTRLTHSLEASSVGRSLGTEIGLRLFNNDHKIASDLGTIVGAASIAHDLGNPPFGHSGEDAIRNWFTNTALGQEAIKDLTEAQRQDFIKYEGNAQGFRILARLQIPNRAGGLQLTHTTLAAFTKYPKESFVLNQDSIHQGKSSKKHGFFQADKDLFRQVATEVGLPERNPGSPWWARHPLAFLVEAADDICYHIIDFEDGYRLKRIDFDDIRAPFVRIIDNSQTAEKADRITEKEQQIAFLRARTIDALVTQVANRFIENESLILNGQFDEELISVIPAAKDLQHIKSISIDKVYAARDIVEVEAAGFEVLGGLLEVFITAVNDKASKLNKATAKSKKLLELLPSQFLKSRLTPDEDKYTRILQIADFVSGMTDSYAVSLYKKITGISLHNA
jgi:dGTPase